MSNVADLRRAERALRARDPVMREIIADVGPCGLDAYWRRQAFPALIQVLIGQQISIHAAAAIHRRFKGLYGGRAPSARRLLDTSEVDLRGAGLSRPKIRYLRDLSQRVTSRQLNLRALANLTDEEVVAALTEVKGIGPWTAQVFMIFRLGRLNVLPVDDIGLLDGARLLYELPERPNAAEFEALAERWRPHRSVACWYLWQGRRRAIGTELR